MAAIRIGYAVGLLHDPGRQMPGGDQAMPEEGLLVFPIQQQHLHQQTLCGLKKSLHFRTASALSRGSKFFLFW